MCSVNPEGGDHLGLMLLVALVTVQLLGFQSAVLILAKSFQKWKVEAGFLPPRLCECEVIFLQGKKESNLLFGGHSFRVLPVEWGWGALFSSESLTDNYPKSCAHWLVTCLSGWQCWWERKLCQNDAIFLVGFFGLVVVLFLPTE